MAAQFPARRQLVTLHRSQFLQNFLRVCAPSRAAAAWGPIASPLPTHPQDSRGV